MINKFVTKLEKGEKKEKGHKEKKEDKEEKRKSTSLAVAVSMPLRSSLSSSFFSTPLFFLLAAIGDTAKS